MFYFGVGHGGAHIMIAFSRDLVHWTADPEPLYKSGGNPSAVSRKGAVGLMQLMPTTALELGVRNMYSAAENLEAMGQRAHLMTQQRFGKTIRLFAPLYLSNECINN